jgi:hypothetical protein
MIENKKNKKMNDANELLLKAESSGNIIEKVKALSIISAIEAETVTGLKAKKFITKSSFNKRK